MACGNRNIVVDSTKARLRIEENRMGAGVDYVQALGVRQSGDGRNNREESGEHIQDMMSDIEVWNRRVDEMMSSPLS